MSCSSCSRSCSPSVIPVARNTCPRWLLIPGATSSMPRFVIVSARRPVSSRSSRAASTSGSSIGQAHGALRKLPTAQAQRIAELLDECETPAVGTAVAGDHKRVVGFVDHAVDAFGAVGPADGVLAHRHPFVRINLTARDEVNPRHRPSIVAVMLLTSLTSSSTPDIADAVSIGGTGLCRSDLVGAATSVAERVAGARPGGRAGDADARHGAGGDGLPDRRRALRPGAPDVGAAERDHILTDSGVQAWLGERPDDLAGLAHIPVRLHARSWHSYAEPSPDAPAYVMYTSGTTGPPKGVLTSRRAVAADIDALAQAWQWTPDDVLVHGLPLFHVHGLVLGLLGSLRIGNRFVHTGKPTPQAYAQAGRRAAHCSSVCRRCGRGWSPTRPRPTRCAAPGCWCREVRRCRCRCSTAWSG